GRAGRRPSAAAVRAADPPAAPGLVVRSAGAVPCPSMARSRRAERLDVAAGCGHGESIHGRRHSRRDPLRVRAARRRHAAGHCDVLRQDSEWSDVNEQAIDIRLAGPADVAALPDIERLAGLLFKTHPEDLGIPEELYGQPNTVETFATAQQAGRLWVAAASDG